MGKCPLPLWTASAKRANAMVAARHAIGLPIKPCDPKRGSATLARITVDCDNMVRAMDELLKKM